MSCVSLVATYISGTLVVNDKFVRATTNSCFGLVDTVRERTRTTDTGSESSVEEGERPERVPSIDFEHHAACLLNQLPPLPLPSFLSEDVAIVIACEGRTPPSVLLACFRALRHARIGTTEVRS